MEEGFTKNGTMMINQDKNYYLRSNSLLTLPIYITKIILIVLFSIVCFSIFENSNNPLYSFLGSSTSFFLITVFAVIIFLKEIKWVVFYSIAFLIKLLIGLTHYLYFIEPNYFKTGAYPALTTEYESVFNEILNHAIDKSYHGIFYFQFHFSRVAHQEILNLISVPFTFFGNYVMTIAPLNTFFSLLMSINLILLSKFKFKYNATIIKSIAIATAYFPLTLITSLLYRDIVGLSLMSIGVTMIILPKNNFSKILMLIVAGFLFYMQRTVYPIILVLAYILNVTFSPTIRNMKLNLLIRVITVIVGIAIFPYIVNISNTESNITMANSAMDISILSLPIKFIVGLIGPFPWINFLLYKTIPANAYQLQDYLQGAFNISVILTLVLHWKNFKGKNIINLLNILGFMLIATGLFTPQMHTTYVAIGFVFLIPYFFNQIRPKLFLKYYLYSVLFMLILNLFVIAFLGNMGISELWRN
jgi:hypothetical protein